MTVEENAMETNHSSGLLIVAWLVVGLPLAWGVYQTVLKTTALFH